MSKWTTERPEGAPDLFDDEGNIDPVKWAAYQEAEAQAQAALVSEYQTLANTRTALSDALALSEVYPAPTPEETLIIDQQVYQALLQFRQLDDPPADVVALAAAVISWRAEI